MNKTIISAKIAADSISPQDERLITMELVFPRIILSEFNKHRMLSSSTSSSRAIPFEKMVEVVQNDPFIPIAFQKKHKGMQGNEYIEVKEGIYGVKDTWLEARNKAVNIANSLHNQGVTKQIANRLLEPFMWCTVLVTGNKESFDAMFKLRCPSYEIELPTSEDRGLDWDVFKFKSKKDFKRAIYSDEIDNYTDLEWLQINKGKAEIHFMDLAEKMYDVINESAPKKLESGQWHVPFIDKFESYSKIGTSEDFDMNDVKISTALAAKTSYTSVRDEQKMDYEKLLNLHDRLLADKHLVPFEHCAKVMTEDEYKHHFRGELESLGAEQLSYEYGYSEEMFIPKENQGWCRNFKGFIQYRHFID